MTDFDDIQIQIEEAVVLKGMRKKGRLNQPDDGDQRFLLS
jgi:hypothetical protein